MTAQSDRQASVRAVTGTAGTYESDWEALFDVAGIAKGDFNGRMLAWVNLKLSSAYTELNGAMQALAVANGAFNFSSMGTFSAGGNAPPPTLTVGAGGTPPTDPTRTTAKPAARWLTVSGQLVTANTVIGLDADALGGASKVTFWAEGTTLDVAAPTVYVDTDANGLPRMRYGYFATLDVASALGSYGAGSVRVYATVVPNDGTMQSRVIGPLLFYPRAATFTDPTNGWDKTLGTAGSGADYTDWQTAMAAFKTSARLYGRITCISTATYDMGEPPNAGIPDYEYNGQTGRVDLVAAPGVTATFRKGSSFNPNGGSVVQSAWDRPWTWWPGVSAVHFKGAGIVIDWLNTDSIRSFYGSDGSFWFDGCKHINSIGTRDTPYWNGSRHPGMTCQHRGDGPYSIQVDFTDCTITNLDPLVNANIFRGNSVYHATSGRLGGSRYVAGNYFRGTDPSLFFYGADVFSVHYTGAGSVATVGYDGTNLVLTVDGTPTNIALSTTYGSGVYWPQDAVTAINAVSGWTATLINNNWRLRTPDGLAGSTVATGYTAHVADGQPLPTNPNPPYHWGLFTARDAKGATVYVRVQDNIHAEFWQRGYNVPDENAIMRGNVFRECFYTTAFFNGVPNDCVIDSNAFYANGLISDSNQLNNGVGAQPASHIVFRNGFLEGGVKTDGGGYDAYCEIRNTIVAGQVSNSYGTAYPAWANNLVMSGNFTGGSHDSGNVSLADKPTLMACVTDVTSGDFRPAGGALTNLRAYTTSYDGRLAQRAASDAPGPWKSGGSAPIWPF